MNMHEKRIIASGKELQGASKAIIMIHGRGATANDILGLASELNTKDFAVLAPQATNFTWYPLSFLAPVKQNEPWLSSALALLSELVADIKKAGIEERNIYFAGFSQGACLTLEFVTRNATRWGGVAAFTGGLIGDTLREENYKGDFGGTPVFIGTGDPDPHVPVERVRATSAILRAKNAVVVEKIYPDIGHTITRDEIIQANKLVFS
jgi:phospholipase/carboxylesterase